MSEPIRVLVLITVMDRGGAETMIMNYYRQIDRSKIQFDFLVNRPYEAAYEKEIQALGGKIFRMCPLYPQYFGRYKKEVREFLKAHPEYQIIHSNLEERSYFALKEARKLNIPVRISHSHNAPRGFDLKSIIRYYFRANLKPQVTHMFTCGEEAGIWLYGKQQQDHVIMMNNAIDAKLYQYDPAVEEEMRKELGLEGKFVIGHVGRFATQKNHTFLIDIFAKVYQQNKNAVLLLVGSGKLESEIMAKVKNLKLTKAIKFLGVRSDIHRVMQAFDVFILPSLFEGFPVTMVEAQAAGLPCIISNQVPPQCAITDNVEIISLQQSPQQWAERVLTYQNTKKQNTYETIVKQNFDIKANAKWLQQFYLEELKSRKKSC